MSKITQGKDFNFFKKETISETSFPDEPQVTINIPRVQSFSLLNEGAVVIEYSFNGNTVHGDLTPETPTAGIFFDNRTANKIWFRVASGSAQVRVEAWSKQ